MIKFSLEKNAFYDMDLAYSDLPSDLVEVTAEQHVELLNAINTGCIIFDDLTYSSPKPSQFHQWDKKTGQWIDPRTSEEIAEYQRSLLPDLNKSQFQLALLEMDRLDQFEEALDNIEDKLIKRKMKIRYDSGDPFKRLGEFVLFMADEIGMTAIDLDQAWEIGLKIES